MQRNYSTKHDIALPGQLSSIMTGAGPSIMAYNNSSTGQSEVQVLSIPGAPKANTRYAFQMGDARAFFTTGDTPTGAELVEGVFNAIRSNGTIAGLALPSLDPTAPTDITLTLRQPGINFPPLSATEGIAISLGQTPSDPTPIPFGRFVGRRPDRLDRVCKLLEAPDEVLLGIACEDRARERIPVARTGYAGMQYRTAYEPYEAVDIVRRTNGATIWVECADTPIDMNTVPYISLMAGEEGKLTSEPGGNNISIENYASVRTGKHYVNDGFSIAEITFNLP